MPNYDQCKLIFCKATDKSFGSVNVAIARRLPHDLFSFSLFLVDLWKLGIKDAFGSDRLSIEDFNDMSERMVMNLEESGLRLEDIDITEAKRIISEGLRIAGAVGTPPIDRSLLETVGSLNGSEPMGSIYKCYKCGEGELSEQDCSRILKIAKKELASGVAGTFEEKKIYFGCESCKGKNKLKGEPEPLTQSSALTMKVSENEALEKLRGMEMGGTPYEQAVWKLSILAVKNRIKPAFFYCEFANIDMCNDIADVLVGLGLETAMSSIRSSKGVLSNIDIEEYVDKVGAGLWVYDPKTRFYEKLVSWMTGPTRTDIGKLLGYPDCCIDWHSKEIAAPIGKLYASIMGISEDEPFDRDKMKTKVDALYERIGSDKELQQRVLDCSSLTKFMQRNFKYPFISHIACDYCIENEDSPSSLLNRKIEQFTLVADRRLHDELIKAAEYEARSFE